MATQKEVQMSPARTNRGAVVSQVASHVASKWRHVRGGGRKGLGVAQSRHEPVRPGAARCGLVR